MTAKSFEGVVFDVVQLKAMRRAYVRSCAAVDNGLNGREVTAALFEALARTIVQTAAAGERDALRLSVEALRQLPPVSTFRARSRVQKSERTVAA